MEPPLLAATSEREQELEGLLRRLLNAMRVRAVAGYLKGRCLACNYPHVRGICRANCPCHEGRAILGMEES